MVTAEIIGSQTPTFAHVPAYATSRGPEAIVLCERAGLMLDPWQREILTGALGLREDLRWSALDAVLVCARQNGKTAVFVARLLAGLFALGEGLLVYSAHQAKTSLEAFRALTYLIQDADLAKVRRISRAHGEEGVELDTGQRVLFQTRSLMGSGRGFTGDAQLFDEAQQLPEAAFANQLPTISARPMSQVWLGGTAADQRVHQHAVVLARARERGLRREERVLYVEFSAGTIEEIDAGKAADPEVWAATNPALGTRITSEAIERERQAMDHRSFCSERLGAGDWPDPAATGGRVISDEAWAACLDATSEMPPRTAIAFDVSPDRSRAAIVAAGIRRDGRAHLEVIDHRRGVDWVAPRVLELARRHQPVAVVCDSRSPASTVLTGLATCRPAVTATTTTEYTTACGSFFDAVTVAHLAHLGDPLLDAAVVGAVKRPIGDQWAWSRKNSYVDITAQCAPLGVERAIAPDEIGTPPRQAGRDVREHAAARKVRARVAEDGQPGFARERPQDARRNWALLLVDGLQACCSVGVHHRGDTGAPVIPDTMVEEHVRIGDSRLEHRGR